MEVACDDGGGAGRAVTSQESRELSQLSPCPSKSRFEPLGLSPEGDSLGSCPVKKLGSMIPQCEFTALRR